MKNILPKLIGDHQKGFLKNRYISKKIQTVNDVMNSLKRHNKTGILLLIDFEKAVESLEWKYIKKVLRAYNFSQSFQNWYEILYKNS